MAETTDCFARLRLEAWDVLEEVNCLVYLLLLYLLQAVVEFVFC